MGGKHKKNIRSEKAKVKLKGAKLPKGLNVTKTEFKVRKITIREQLKERQHVEGQRPPLNLKDLLTRLKHHTSSFRLEALRNLRDVSGHPGLLGHLSEIVQTVSKVCLDPDKDTRRESFKTLSSLLGAFSSDIVAPFFHVISSYLRCAMSHIQPTIQEDSLLLLDVLLQHTPHLVATHSTKIFQNFLEMISRVRAEGDQAGRTLTVKIGEKQTTVKWRSKVLERLHQMLQTLADYNRKNSLKSTCGVRNKSETHTFNVKEPQHFSLTRPYTAYQALNGLSEIFCRATAAQSKLAGLVVANDAALRGYVEHLMPLLLDAWIEVRPQETTDDRQRKLLSYDAAHTLKVILDIIANLWTLVEIHEKEVNNNDLSRWLQQNFAEVFAQNFLQPAFPYQQSDSAIAYETSKRARKNALDADGQYCLQQNLCISHLMCRFFANNIERQSSKFVTVVQYLNKTLQNIRPTTLNNWRYLEVTLRAYLFENGLELLDLDAVQMRQLLRYTIGAFLDNKFAERENASSRLLVLLCDIVQSPPLLSKYGAAEFDNFLVDLPQLLLQPTIAEAALLSMSSLGKQKNTVFLRALSLLNESVITNIQNIQVLGAHNVFEGKRHIMNLFYWTDSAALNNDKRELLMQRVDETITDKRIVSYFKFILT